MLTKLPEDGFHDHKMDSTVTFQASKPTYMQSGWVSDVSPSGHGMIASVPEGEWCGPAAQDGFASRVASLELAHRLHAHSVSLSHL